jgi:hypothetical protein
MLAGNIRLGHVREEYLAWQPMGAAYQPSRFYLRELPPINAVWPTPSAWTC